MILCKLHINLSIVELIQGPSSLVVEHGSSAELLCSARSSGQVTFIWVQTDYGISEVYPDVGSYNVTNSLLLHDIVNSNSYQCVATSNGHRIKSQEATIRVINEPSK